MRASTPGPIGALLMVVPLLAIPLFAIMGVPQFAPLVASPGVDTEFAESWNVRESASRPEATPQLKLGKAAVSDKTGVGESARCSVDELFAPYSTGQSLSHAGLSLEGDSLRNDGRSRATDSATSPGQTNPRASAFDDANLVLAGSVGRDLPAEALEGYSAARDRRAVPRSRDAGDQNEKSIGSGTGFAANIPNTEPTNAPLRRFDREPDFTWDQAVQRLKKLDIHKYHLESLPADGGFSFRCSYTAPDNPRVTRRFESEAAEPLAAVRIVLEQIEAWRAGP